MNQTSEACDGAADLACRGRCLPDCTCAPPPPVCGDGVVNQASEQCDGASAAACPGRCLATCLCRPPLQALVVADTYVASDTPTKNFNSAGLLGADGNPVKRIFLRTTVSGVGADQTVTLARLRLQVATNSGAQSVSGGRIHTVACGWAEASLTFNNAPTFNVAVLDTKAAVAIGQVVDFNVTSAIHGDGTYCFVIDNTSTDGVDYQSREAGAGAPQLLVDVTP
jgi:hypothetical protein